MMPDGTNRQEQGGVHRAPLPRLPFPWWYIPLILLTLWIWQDVIYTMTVRTIPYSEFKQKLGAGEVAECQIKQTEILGKIVPKPKTTPEGGSKDAERSSPVAPVSRTQVPPGRKDAGGEEAQSAKVVSSPPHDVKTKTDSDGEPAASRKTAPAKESTASKTTASSTTTATKAKRGAAKPFLFRTVRVEDPKLVDELEAAHVEFSGVRPGVLSTFLYAWLLPIGIMVAIWLFLSRGLRSAGQAVMSFGRSQARIVADRETGVRFRDVAGCDEAKYELQEVVDFLKNPQRYITLGAKIPKGVLLVGLPGTGKTLMSRAVAGEAGVPFFSLSGSEFVEMFVGVGASRVRDLFVQAKAQAPCIVFIDELDAVGRERGVHMGPVNDEREQTLNQLLVEMDGFEANAGVILLAATNRPEVLDRALLRPGRFDRHVVIDPPDLDGREAILNVHSRDKPLDEDVDLRKIAQATPGYSGADLANTMNEAALLAARRKAARIAQADVEEAVEKVVAGPERKSRRLDEQAKRRVAYHEVGHALVAAHSEHADPVHKISIVPRGRAALGYTLQLPTEDQLLMTRSELLDRLRGLLGGRASEEIIFGEVSTGAENDLERATTLARQMVCLYGMGDAVGLVHCGQRPGTFLPEPMPSGQLDCSEQTAHDVDDEVKAILDSAYHAALTTLKDHRDELEKVAEELIRDETIDGATFQRLIGQPPSPARKEPKTNES